MADTIQTLWVGARLSAMEKLCLRSFLLNGHPVHLYVYQQIEDIPRGVIVRDAGEVLPQAMLFTYAEHKSYAGFANFFRYRMLLEKGGWWVDTDTICLRPFEFEQPHVFSSQLSPQGAQEVNCGTLRVPARSASMQFLWRNCQQSDVTRLFWGQTGPALMARMVAAFGLEESVCDPDVFCPVRYTEWQKLLDPALRWDFPPQTRAVHLWNEMWRRENQDKDQSYPPDCLYEKLKRFYPAEVEVFAIGSPVPALTPASDLRGRSLHSGLPDAKEIYTPGHEVTFSAAGDACNYELYGWSSPEDWGTWTEGYRAMLWLRLARPLSTATRLVIDAGAFVVPEHPHLEVEVECAGEILAKMKIESPERTRHGMLLPAMLMDGRRELALTLHILNPESPLNCARSSDPRLLGLSVFSVSLEQELSQADIDVAGTPDQAECRV